METYRARDLFREIAEAAHLCGDPGMQFDTTVNDWHTCSATARINASNPCSEYMFLDDSACNLASLNLMHFRSPLDGSFDVESFRHAVDVVLLAHGDYRRLQQVPHRENHREQPRLPAARPRLRQPGRSPDGIRPSLRLGGGAALCRCHHLPDVRARPIA